MSEQLEKFIRTNRRQFDDLEAPSGLWDAIEKDLNSQTEVQPAKQPKLLKLSFVLRIAASLVIVLAAGFMYWKLRSGPVNISKIDPQLAQQQHHYVSLIREKRDEIRQIKAEDPALYNEFSSEIKKMEDNYNRLKKDLSTSPNQEATVKAMIRNLQIQIEVLNQQLTIIEQVNEFKRSSNHDTKGI
jgi:hypothetical protein